MELCIDSGKLKKSFFHGLSERGGEISFDKFPFKLVLIPVEDSIVYQLVCCGYKPDTKRIYPAQKKEKKRIPRSVIEGEIVL
jgi:hypothetical protein